MNVKAKWILAALAVGLALGAGAVLLFLYRPASAAARELRERAEAADRELAAALADNHRLSRELGDRIRDLEEALGRERTAGQRALERARRSEERARDLAEVVVEEGSVAVACKYLTEEILQVVNVTHGLALSVAATSAPGPDGPEGGQEDESASSGKED